MDYKVLNRSDNISSRKTSKTLKKNSKNSLNNECNDAVPTTYKTSKSTNLMSQDLAALSRQLASQGNLLAQNEEYKEAVKLFTQAIALFSSDYRYFGNRSYCYDRLGNYKEALTDAISALKISSTWAKGYFRKGRALAGLKRYVEAEQAFTEVLKLGCNYPDMDEQLHAVRMAHLLDMGFEKNKVEVVLRNQRTLQEALDDLLSERLAKSDIYTNDKVSSIYETANDAKDDTTNFNKNNRSLWVGNVGSSVTEDHLEKYFKKFGEIASLKILYDSGCAFINYKKPESAKLALTTARSIQIAGITLLVRYQERVVGSNNARQPAGSVYECRYWRSTGCVFGSLCRYLHVPSHKGVDLQIVERNPYQSVTEV